MGTHLQLFKISPHRAMALITALGLGLGVSCSSTDSGSSGSSDGDTMGRMEKEFTQGGSGGEAALKNRKSTFDEKKEFRTKEFGAHKEFKTSESKLRKLWARGDDKFSTQAWQKKDYRETRSQYEGQTSALADDKVSTKAFWASAKKSSSTGKVFGQSDKTFATKTAAADGKAYWMSNREVPIKQLGRNANPTVNVIGTEDNPGELNEAGVRKLLGR